MPSRAAASARRPPAASRAARMRCAAAISSPLCSVPTSGGWGAARGPIQQKILRLDLVAAGEHERPLDRVAELADVARPIIAPVGAGVVSLSAAFVAVGAPRHRGRAPGSPPGRAGRGACRPAWAASTTAASGAGRATALESLRRGAGEAEVAVLVEEDQLAVGHPVRSVASPYGYGPPPTATNARPRGFSTSAQALLSLVRQPERGGPGQTGKPRRLLVPPARLSGRDLLGRARSLPPAQAAAWRSAPDPAGHGSPKRHLCSVLSASTSKSSSACTTSASPRNTARCGPSKLLPVL